MKRRFQSSAGFTLLEVMVAAALGVIVLTTGLAVGTQLQKRALFEEQTMMAQTTGRALQERLSADISRAGNGMGNTPISFSDTDQRFAVQVYSDPGTDTYFQTDYVAPPTGSPTSNALRLYWGRTRDLVFLDTCAGGGTVVRNGANEFCLAADSSAGMKPAAGQPATLAVAVNGDQGENVSGNTILPVSCLLRVTNVQPDATVKKLTATVGPDTGTLTNLCTNSVDPRWQLSNWIVMALEGVAYRVNWTGGFPTLEALPHGATTWQVVSRDVEQMRVREAVADLTTPSNAYRWFPDASAGRGPLDACTTASCTVDNRAGEAPPSVADANEALRMRLRNRVRELEITLVVRTRRLDTEAVAPGNDENGHRRDGYKRRTITFRVAPRGLGMTGLQVLEPVPSGSGT
ncbi:type II secretion system protein [Corallococcus exiguus]|uniref:PilW family protein n=1 Tax=Corallococcus TaxID=83461 RepID=UPI000ED57BA6|nr:MULTISPECIES: type II secretion system protein [Corallococcus]NPC68605.1 type II secretion system protein [Corallococcus exiguus]RKI04211.1 type II secretion system protein [Corallococcus sp. AB038B]